MTTITITITLDETDFQKRGYDLSEFVPEDIRYMIQEVLDEDYLDAAMREAVNWYRAKQKRAPQESATIEPHP